MVQLADDVTVMSVHGVCQLRHARHMFLVPNPTELEQNLGSNLMKSMAPSMIILAPPSAIPSYRSITLGVIICPWQASTRRIEGPLRFGSLRSGCRPAVD